MKELEKNVEVLKDKIEVRKNKKFEIIRKSRIIIMLLRRKKRNKIIGMGRIVWSIDEGRVKLGVKVEIIDEFKGELRIWRIIENGEI